MLICVVESLFFCLPASPLQRIFPKGVQIRRDNALLKIAPNPFVQATTIDLVLARAQIISLNLYNSAGMLLKNIALMQSLSEGSHQFNLDKNDLEGAGLYFLEIVTSEMMITQKLMLLE